MTRVRAGAEKSIRIAAGGERSPLFFLRSERDSLQACLRVNSMDVGPALFAGPFKLVMDYSFLQGV